MPHSCRRFSVDADLLDAVVADLGACEQALASTADDLDHQMTVLDGTWEGLAATAHRAAHHRWAQGMRDMHNALVELRAAARSAHGNYVGAVSTNVEMWRQVT